jgi:hypothetical protein
VQRCWHRWTAAIELAGAITPSYLMAHMGCVLGDRHAEVERDRLTQIVEQRK